MTFPIPTCRFCESHLIIDGVCDSCGQRHTSNGFRREDLAHLFRDDPDPPKWAIAHGDELKRARRRAIVRTIIALLLLLSLLWLVRNAFGSVGEAFSRAAADVRGGFSGR